MSDSLVISNAIELLGGGVVCQDPLAAGAIYRLMQGADPGAPQPTSDFVASLILDGERPFGRRASNRTIILPVVIIAPTRQILAAAREVLEQTIDQDQFTITWTRDPGPGGTPLPSGDSGVCRELSIGVPLCQVYGVHSGVDCRCTPYTCQAL